MTNGFQRHDDDDDAEEAPIHQNFYFWKENVAHVIEVGSGTSLEVFFDNFEAHKLNFELFSGPFPVPFPLFSSFLPTDDSKLMLCKMNDQKLLPHVALLSNGL